MNEPLFFSMVLILQASCLLVSWRASKKQRSNNDYYLAGKTLSFFPLMMTLVATLVGGGLILGAAEEAYRYGWPIIFYPLGTIASFMLLGTTLGKRLAALPVSTVAQIFEYSYGSKTLKIVASVLSMVTLFMVAVAQVLASQKFLASLQMNNFLWLLAFWVLVFIYTMWAGMKGIANIDVIQASFFLVALVISVVPVLLDFKALGYASLANADVADLDSGTMVAWFLMPCLFILIEQDIAQRCFSAQSAAVLKKAAFGSAFLVFLASLVPVCFGLLGRASSMKVPSSQSVLISLVQQMTTPTITALVAGAVLMAIVSTMVSLINSITSNLVQDFELKIMKNCREVCVSRALTLGIGIAAFSASFLFENIVRVLIIAYELTVVTLFVPVIMSLISKQRTPLPAALAIAFGAASFLGLWFCKPLFIPREILELAASGIGFSIGYYLQKAKGLCDVKQAT